MISGILLFHLVAIPLVFMLGRMSNKIAFVRVKAQDRSTVSEFLRGRD
ncbi:hypothetical protein OS242_05010 [Tumebacillus sp. DT12]|uniref:CNNM transmembrane domain-containing protein n=1 Tax=Tumebacillus lacus TaxID=2995335 RepID=A0ABT3WXB5_9BACL|nr:hypothetical protein [Tumebacillus lacus]MCX7569313.1 hypothetical protein [Tumebacillus lacus]